MNISQNQNNRGHSRAVVAVCTHTDEVVRFSSVRSCAKYLKRNAAAVTKVCQGAWHLCNNHKVFYEEDYEVIRTWEGSNYK